MCNAWNHSNDCRCGWGGKGHLGCGGTFARDQWANITFKTYRELLIGATHPNAHCPVCGLKVFFYESPYGGRVFFDDLGPPWSRHPCTSSGHRGCAVSRVAIDFDEGIKVAPPALRDGWKPFLCEIIEPVATEKSIQKLEGWLDGVRKTFFVQDGGLSEGAPFFIKKENDIWLLSTLAGAAETIQPKTIRAYVFESQVHDLSPLNAAQPRQIQTHHKNKATPNSSPKPSAQATSQKVAVNMPKKKALKRRQHKKPNQPPPPPPLDQRTSLEFAMQEAEKRRQASNKPTRDSG